MAKRKNAKSARSGSKEDQRLRDVYAKSRASFSAADLQKYTEVEEGIAMGEVLAELESAHRRLSRKRS